MASIAKVWLGFAPVFVLFVVIVSERMTEVENQFTQDTTDRFSKLSRADLITAWHTESHRQCLHQLTWAIDFSCRFDPYRNNTTGHGRHGAVDEHQNNLTSQDVAPNQTNNSEPLPSKEIPDVLSKKFAMTFLFDEKFWSQRRRTYFQEQCTWEETGRGCRTEQKENANSSDISKDSADVDNCRWEEHGESCKRHPSRKNELEKLRSKTSAMSFLSDKQLRKGKRNRGIMEECCLSKGCFWEEYGEYCHGHDRQRTDRETVCVSN